MVWGQHMGMRDKMIRATANLMAQQHGESSVQPLGVSAFIHRQPELGSRRSRALDIDRVLASDRKVLSSWFDAVRRQLHGIKFRPSNIWNMDEVGCRHNHQQSSYARFHRQAGPPISIQQANIMWTSSIECISATGESILPLIIHRGRESATTTDNLVSNSRQATNPIRDAGPT